MHNNDNGLPIKTWINDPFDRELFHIMPLLEYLAKVNDVREYIKRMGFNNDFSIDNAIKIKAMIDVKLIPNKELSGKEDIKSMSNKELNNIPESKPIFDKKPNDNPEQKAKNNNNIKIIMCRDSINCNDCETKIAKSNNSNIIISSIKALKNTPSELNINDNSGFLFQENNVQLLPVKLMKKNPSLPRLNYDIKPLNIDKQNYSPQTNSTTNTNESEKDVHLKMFANDPKKLKNSSIMTPKRTITSIINNAIIKKDSNPIKIIPKDFQKNSEDITKMYLRNSTKRKILMAGHSNNLNLSQKITNNQPNGSIYLQNSCAHIRGNRILSVTNLNSNDNQKKSIKLKPVFINNSYKLGDDINIDNNVMVKSVVSYLN